MWLLQDAFFCGYFKMPWGLALNTVVSKDTGSQVLDVWLELFLLLSSPVEPRRGARACVG